MSKPVLTTTKNRSRCLAYRDGKRCGRVAQYLVQYQKRIGCRNQFVAVPMCYECKQQHVMHKDADVLGCSLKGYTVKEGVAMGYGHVRQYKPVEQLCINCEKAPPYSEHDKYCADCGPGATDAEGLEGEFLAFERSCERG